MTTENLLSHARGRFSYESARRLLQEKYQSKMLFAYQSGMFQAGPELLTLLHSCPVDDDVVILDLYKNPVLVNPGELQRLAHDRWQEQMNAWLVEHTALTQTR